MKGPLDRTKVVLRHLPPTISQSNLVDQIDSRFSGRYRWLAFRPGKSSTKHLKYARAYIDFNESDDVIEFAEVFKGHVFVNEKGTQFRTIVEYAPSQRIPKQWSKKDGREGTILKDPEYLEFLEFLAKPVENLPSAEIQLERKEAERAGAPKDAPIVTPLMDFVRQKRAAKGGGRRTVMNGKPARRGGGMSSRNPVSGSSKRGSEKRASTTMQYVLRDSSKIMGNKDKSAYSLVRKLDDQQLNDKSISSASIAGNEALEGENGGTGSTGLGKKKILLLKGKEKEIPNVSGGPLLQQNTVSPDKAAAPKHNQQREASGKIARSILLSRDTRQNQPSLGSQSELLIQSPNQERGKKPPRPPSLQSLQKDTNGVPEDKLVSNDLHASPTEKQERRARNKDRPDRGVWTPLRRSDGLHSSDDSLSLSASQISEAGGSAEESKQDILVTRGGGRGRRYSSDNGNTVGSYRHGVRRASAYNVKEADGSSAVEGKSSKRGGSSGYASQEKQVWVQKSSSAT
ncbi:regulator of nonsense transcripts UPF3-like isoform X1 [Salvia splendens]|uniref:regulator of nonsense transcripts UPF3-like isoform X1 n=1 Tax=Salvia splendens TaxID=180675 RepID=UPI001C256132|nr:regulator of nonsense transcripts UPF3-like isoform X1 [Salvia splendens]XP_042061772.1 regulator of nonsense transcripts UPF3-like isoform X1 [Salvia splendens]